MHMTVYYARRAMPGVTPTTEPALVALRVADTRFMVMAPGGENPRPELEPGQRKVGIRIQKQSDAMPTILAYRGRLLQCETMDVLGWRAPSTTKKNAFGARHFQPHIAMLRAGSNIDRDLAPLGRLFREEIGILTFDSFVVDVVTKKRETLPL
jgi:hypothetical protein